MLRSSPNSALDALQALVSNYEDVCRRKLGPLSQNRDTRAEKALGEISDLVLAAEANDGRSVLVESLRSVLVRRDGVLLADIVKETSRIVPSLAVELGKAVPVVAAEHAGLLLTSGWVQPLRDVLIQCFRNAVYHGIEPRAVRESAGKADHGQIHVRAHHHADAVEIHLSDDGRGLPLAALRRLSGAPELTDEELAERVFDSGVSTASEIGHTAGRGVGLDLSRALLRKRGGDIVVYFTGEERDGFRPFSFLIRLPGAAALNDRERTSNRPSWTPNAAE